MKQYKTCNGCRGLTGPTYVYQAWYWGCHFGLLVIDANHNPIPQVPCEKPMTRARFRELYKVGEENKHE